MAEKKVIEIEVKTKEAVKETEKLTDSLEDQGKEQTELTGITEIADKATGGLIGKFRGLTGTLTTVTGGFKTMRLAIIATGIGALVVIVGSLIAAFNSSEAGQNKFAKLMGVIGSVVGNVMDVVSDFGELIIGIFSGDSKAIKSITSFGTKIYDVLGLPIKNIITIVQSLGSAITELASGNITGALDALKDGAEGVKQNFAEANEVIIDSKNALVNFGKEAIADAKLSQEISDMRAKATIQERELLIERAIADRDTAQLNEDAINKEKFNAKQRGEFLRQAQDIQEKITNKEIEVAKLRADAYAKENSLSKSNIEASDLEAQAAAKVIELETRRLSRNKEIVSQLQGINAEEKAIADAKYKEAKDASDALLKIKQDEILAEQKIKEEQAIQDAKTELQRQESIDAIRLSYTQKLEDLEDETELQKIERQQERAILELERLGANELEKTELLIFYTNLKENEKTKIEKENADARIEIAELEAQAKSDALNSYGEALGSIGGLIGESTGVGKVAAVASAGISTYLSAQKAYESQLIIPTPDAPIRAALAAGVAVASGLANVKKILSVKVPKGGGGASGSAPSLSAPSASAPSFNLVGAQGLDNQIATGLGTQPKQPIRAYVVGSEITTQQSLDRNILQNASLG
jgi:hypothetical protein